MDPQIDGGLHLPGSATPLPILPSWALSRNPLNRSRISPSDLASHRSDHYQCVLAPFGGSDSR